MLQATALLAIGFAVYRRGLATSAWRPMLDEARLEPIVEHPFFILQRVRNISRLKNAPQVGHVDNRFLDGLRNPGFGPGV